MVLLITANFCVTILSVHTYSGSVTILSGHVTILWTSLDCTSLLKPPKICLNASDQNLPCWCARPSFPWEGGVWAQDYLIVALAFMTQQPCLSYNLPLLPLLGSESFSCLPLCLPPLLMLELCHSLHLLVLPALLTSLGNLCRPHLHTCKRRGNVPY